MSGFNFNLKVAPPSTPKPGQPGSLIAPSSPLAGLPHRRSQRDNHIVEEAYLMDQACKRLVKYFEDIRKEGSKTGSLNSPAQIETFFSDAGVDLSLLEGEPHEADAILKAVDLTLQHSVRTDSLEFHNQLYGRSEAAGLVGQFVSSSVGGACHTFEVAPVFTMMEKHSLDKFAAIAGFPPNSDGLFVPGGSFGNMYAIHLSRWKKYGNKIKQEGIFGLKPIAIFVSAQAHYSYSKSTSFLGIGTNNCVKVAVDSTGAMMPAALDNAIEQSIRDGKEPLLVGATAGSTVFGAYDNFVKLKEIADKYKCWFHIDGCWGAPALLSNKPEINGLVKGFDKADSFTWNPHKFMSVPMQCAVFISRHEDILNQCNACHASYLFQKDKENTEHDMGDKTIQCGRNPDACKLWFAWKMVGDEGWAWRVDKGVELAQNMAEYAITEGEFDGRFQLVKDISFTNLCFWYLPPSLKHLDPSRLKHGSKEWNDVHHVAVEIKKTMQERGLAMIGYQSVVLDQPADEPFPNFFRMIVSGVAQLTAGGLRKELHDMDNLGKELFEGGRGPPPRKVSKTSNK